MSRRRRIATALAVLSLAAPLVSALAAQAIAQDTVSRLVPSVDPVSTAAPTIIPLAFAERVASPALITPAGVTQPKRVVGAATPTTMRIASQDPHNPAMMIVGGAALIVGAVVGGKAGTIVMIGGGVLGLVGLWNYLQ
jgi:methionine-rich copper-binding protein CopC